MLDGPGLAVSVPIRELGDRTRQGSLLTLEQLEALELSDALRSALRLVREAHEDRGLRIVAIARPEIFTNGASLEWLRDKLEGVEDHLILSDGSTIRTVDTLRNHVFLYNSAAVQAFSSLRKLAVRAPELFGTLVSQVNSAFCFGSADDARSPETRVVLPRAEAGEARATSIYRFYLNRFTPEDSASRMLASAPVPDAALQFEEWVYAPLTDAAVEDGVFMRETARAIVEAYRKPKSGFVLRLPDRRGAMTDFDRIRHVLAQLSLARNIPHVPLSNVFLAMGDLQLGAGQGDGSPATLIAHASLDFWRRPAAFYSRFKAVILHAPADMCDLERSAALYRSVCGEGVSVEIRKSAVPVGEVVW